jgi:DNA-binding CsgD family transcriptional regulator
MEARLIQPAVDGPLRGFEVLDVEALQAYLSLHVSNIRNLANIPFASFGTILQGTGFHLQVELSDAGEVNVTEIDYIDRRVGAVIHAVGEHCEVADVGRSLNLSLFRVESGDAAARRLALLSLGLQSTTGLYSYQMFDVTSEIDVTGLLSGPSSLSAVHAVTHFLLCQHFESRRLQLRSPGTAVAAQASRPLTERQLEILRHVVKGLSDKQIAKQLGLSQHTVRNMVRRLLDKYSLHKRIQLCRLLEGPPLS